MAEATTAEDREAVLQFRYSVYGTRVLRSATAARWCPPARRGAVRQQRTPGWVAERSETAVAGLGKLSKVGGESVRYAQSGDLQIAFKVAGDGPDVVMVPGLLDTIEAEAIAAPTGRLAARLARVARLTRIDKRGTGLSDRLPRGVVPTLGERVEDVLAVMDAADIASAALLGVADGAIVALQLAASYPTRVSALFLTAAVPRIAWAPDWTWGRTEAELEAQCGRVEAGWGTGISAALFGVSDERGRQLFARVERLAGTPGTIASTLRAAWSDDVRDVLPNIAAPTLIGHYVGHSATPIEGSRYLAERIPGAELIELSGDFRDGDDFAAIVEERLTGRRSVLLDRVLKTVLFTDIVGSTEQLSVVGDRRWRELLDTYDAVVHREIDRFGGRSVSSSGDGHFSVFDSPARGIECARVLIEDAQLTGVEVRAGLHTGECEVRGDDYAGIAVHIGARVAALAGSGEILVTATVRDVVAGSGIQFQARGSHILKGVHEPRDLYAVV